MGIGKMYSARIPGQSASHDMTLATESVQQLAAIIVVLINDEPGIYIRIMTRYSLVPVNGATFSGTG